MLDAADYPAHPKRGMKEEREIRAHHFRPVAIKFRISPIRHSDALASMARLSLTEDKIIELARTCKTHPRLENNCGRGERDGYLVYKFDHTWAMMFTGGARIILHQDEEDRQTFYVYKCFSGAEKNLYCKELNDLQSRWEHHLSASQ